MSRCIICDAGAAARRGEVDGAIATTAVVVLLQAPMKPPEERMSVLKDSLCVAHRREWPMLLLRGGVALDEAAEAT